MFKISLLSKKLINFTDKKLENFQDSEFEFFRVLFLYEHKHIGRFSNLLKCTLVQIMHVSDKWKINWLQDKLKNKEC